MGQTARRKGQFVTTRWSVVVAAGQQSRDALGALCELYWYPIYAFVRRTGAGPDEATDLTQGFFTRLLEKRDFAAADPARGRFRNWLLASMKHYQSNQRAHQQALKRGGGAPAISLDSGDSERRYLLEPGHDLTPERLYERRWANLLIDRVIDQLRAEQVELGKAALFDRVRGFLVHDPPDATYADLAREFPETNANALKTWVSRLGKRFRDLLRTEISDTVESPDDVDDELRHLAECLGAGQ